MKVNINIPFVEILKMKDIITLTRLGINVYHSNDLHAENEYFVECNKNIRINLKELLDVCFILQEPDIQVGPEHIEIGCNCVYWEQERSTFVKY